ncbi:MAG TPA: hypothetical protein VGD04_03470 [Methylophilus sp.]
MSKRITIDFSAPSNALASSFTLLGCMILLLGVASTLYVLQCYTQAHAQYLEAQQRLSDLTQVRKVNTPAIAVDKVAPTNMVEVTKVVAELNTPWQALFAAIELVNLPDVAILGISPNKKTRLVTLTGQAKNLPVALHYVAQLQAHSGLAEVYLQKHQVEITDPFKPVSFTITGRWP